MLDYFARVYLVHLLFLSLVSRPRINLLSPRHNSSIRQIPLLCARHIRDSPTAPRERSIGYPIP